MQFPSGQRNSFQEQMPKVGKSSSRKNINLLSFVLICLNFCNLICEVTIIPAAVVNVCFASAQI